MQDAGQHGGKHENEKQIAAGESGIHMGKGCIGGEWEKENKYKATVTAAAAAAATASFASDIAPTSGRSDQYSATAAAEFHKILHMISKVNQCFINQRLHTNTKEERAREQGERNEKGKGEGKGKGAPTNKQKDHPKTKAKAERG